MLRFQAPQLPQVVSERHRAARAARNPQGSPSPPPGTTHATPKIHRVTAHSANASTHLSRHPASSASSGGLKQTPLPKCVSTLTCISFTDSQVSWRKTSARRVGAARCLHPLLGMAEERGWHTKCPYRLRSWKPPLLPNARAGGAAALLCSCRHGQHGPDPPQGQHTAV